MADSTTSFRFAPIFSNGTVRAVEVEARYRPLGALDLPDRKTADLNALVLRRDLIGGKRDAVGRGRQECSSGQ